MLKSARGLSSFPARTRGGAAGDLVGFAIPAGHRPNRATDEPLETSGARRFGKGRRILSGSASARPRTIPNKPRIAPFAEACWGGRRVFLQQRRRAGRTPMMLIDPSPNRLRILRGPETTKGRTGGCRCGPYLHTTRMKREA